MARTQAALELWLPPVLARLAHDYLWPVIAGEKKDIATAHIGHWELCLEIGDASDGLMGACRGGHMELVHLMIEKGATDWNWGLMGACENGHIEIVRLLISRGATYCGNCYRVASEH